MDIKIFSPLAILLLLCFYKGINSLLSNILVHTLSSKLIPYFALSLVTSLPGSLGQLTFGKSTEVLTVEPTTAPCGVACGGATYIRWGNKDCRAQIDTELVYSGIAGGSLFSEDGGASNYLCMPDDPHYNSTLTARSGNFAQVHGAEYKQPRQGLDNHNVPCAVCRAATRLSVVMIPAEINCPATWTMEYRGFLMAARSPDKRTTFECVDEAMQTLSTTDTGGAIFIHTKAACNTGLPCSSTTYNSALELSCVVCTK